MKKGTFTIATTKGFKEVEGYTETIGALSYGFHKDNNAWVITELLSGMKVADCRTRKAAVKKAEEVHDIVFNALQNNKNTKKRVEAMQNYKKAQEGENEMKQKKKGTQRNQGMKMANDEVVRIHATRYHGLSKKNIRRIERKEKMATWERNVEHAGIEITFKEKPEKAVRDMLKSVGFRWHNAKQLWYAKETEARVKVAEMVCA